ncbi:MAG: prephenate dehydratase [Candidatus Lokiarchaeota archaeon]|nr:prephenate dehydratase [Candidatus Lokiarchaeota archaeon]
MNDINELRKKIDLIDKKILELLDERCSIVLKIGEIKKELNIETYQPNREREIINNLKKTSKTLNDVSIESIWKEIIGASKLIQGTTIKIGYLGPKGTFTHQAALEFFPKTSSDFIACKNIYSIFEDIEKEKLNYGVIPIENSLQGTVRETLDQLIDREIYIFGEIELRIIQNLIVNHKTDLLQIKKIYSHPQAFAQTRTWIKTNLPNVKLVNTESTAEAVNKIKELGDLSNAAIGTEFAASINSLKIINSNIEDNPSNFTRFIVISKKKNDIKEGDLKTSILYVTKHKPGALYSVLKSFADANINLLKIESRPRRKGRWEYIFLMDFEGDIDTTEVKHVIDDIEHNVIWYKVLGSYPIYKNSN